MKRLFITLILIASVVFCLLAQNKQSYQLSGTVSDSLNNTWMYLSKIYLNNDSGMAIDSSFVSNGKFEFYGNVNDNVKNVYNLYSEKYPNISGIVVLETGNIIVRMDTDTIVGGFIPLYANGTPLNNQITDSILALSYKLAKWGQAMMIDANAENIIYKVKEEQEKMRPIARKMYENLVAFVRENATNAAGEYIFSLFGNAIKEKEMNEILPLLSDEMQQIYNNRTKNISKIQLGQKYIPFSCKTQANADFNFADIVGEKYFLLDFWASWCVHCIKEIPNLTLLNEKYKDKDLVIISISTDTNNKQWGNAIAKNKMTWLQLIDNPEDSKNVAKLYDVYAIPATFLIDHNGNIMAKDVRGNELIKLIDKLLQ
ncbi:MAG: AhpC/TSA family protein [Prevotellaceae bacterium]|jgi:thiol-disulfide isomerase/thioredoxin|nr:AhpC/TSA family protein [Prevotellaceae bacterium]